MSIRKNVKNLTAAERSKFVAAVKELHRQGGYQPFVGTHVSWALPPLAGPSYAHFTSSFLPWHRYFVLEFERALQRIDATVSVPYWDFTRERSTTAIPWRSDFMGGDGSGADHAVTTGPFRQGQWVIDTYTNQNFIKRAFGANAPDLPTLAQLQAVLGMNAYNEPPWDGSTANGFVSHLEGWAETAGGNMHNQVHSWIGGTILSAASPADPVFWLLHAFLDKVWVDWQAAHPGAPKYLPEAQVDNKIVYLTMPLEPWGNPVTPAYVLDHSQWYSYQ